MVTYNFLLSIILPIFIEFYLITSLIVESIKMSFTSPCKFTNSDHWTFEPRHDKTNKMSVRPSKTQISLGIHPVWSESLLCAQWVAKDPRFLHADSEDSDQTGRMPRLIWVFAGRTLTLLVLSCRGSFFWPHTNYRNDSKYSDRQIWESIVDPDETVPGAVWSESTLFAILSFKVQYSVVKPNCSNFRILTAIFSGVRIFPIFLVIGSVDWPVLVRLVKFGIFDAPTMCS